MISIQFVKIGVLGCFAFGRCTTIEKSNVEVETALSTLSGEETHGNQSNEAFFFF